MISEKLQVCGGVGSARGTEALDGSQERARVLRHALALWQADATAAVPGAPCMGSCELCSVRNSCLLLLVWELYSVSPSASSDTLLPSRLWSQSSALICNDGHPLQTH